MLRKTTWLFLILLIASCSSKSIISPEESWNKVDEGAILVDVRTPSEYKSGHIEGAINIPLSELKESIGTLNADAEVVLYCRSGNRAGVAKEILESEGYYNIYNGGGYQDLLNFEEDESKD